MKKIQLFWDNTLQHLHSTEVKIAWIIALLKLVRAQYFWKSTCTVFQKLLYQDTLIGTTRTNELVHFCIYIEISCCYKRNEWMKGICHVWSRRRHSSPSLPGDRHLKLGSKSDHPAEISGNIVRSDALGHVHRYCAPFPANMQIMWSGTGLSFLRKRKCPKMNLLNPCAKLKNAHFRHFLKSYFRILERCYTMIWAVLFMFWTLNLDPKSTIFVHFNSLTITFANWP